MLQFYLSNLLEYLLFKAAGHSLFISVDIEKTLSNLTKKVSIDEKACSQSYNEILKIYWNFLKLNMYHTPTTLKLIVLIFVYLILKIAGVSKKYADCW